MHARCRDDVLVEDPRGLATAVHRDRRRPGAGRGSDTRRQDQPRRVRDGLVHRELGVRADPQPPRPVAGARRIERRIGGRGRRRVRAARPGLRHRRFDPPTGGVVRCRRGEAHLRLGVALRTGGLRELARSDRAVRNHGHRRRAAPRRDRRPRPARLHVDRVAVRAGAARGRARCRWSAGRRGRRAGRRRGLPARGARCGRRRRSGHWKRRVPPSIG